MPRVTDGPRRERVIVLLDATAAHPDDAELTQYLDAVVSALDAELVVACRPDGADHYRRLAPAAIIETTPAALRFSGARMLWRQFGLPRIARRHDVDAVHSPRPPVPLLIARPRVVTVHSLRCFERSAPSRRGDALRRLAVRIAVRAADEVVALRPDIALSLETTLGFSADDVLVVPGTTDLDRFAAAHRVAYRAAASHVPAATGPITLPTRAEGNPDSDSGGVRTAH